MANTLSSNIRLLHHIIRQNFSFEDFRFNFISKRELVVMCHLVQGMSMSLLGIMMIQMREATKRMKACLLYGMILTTMFETFGISLKSESFKKLLSYDEYHN